MVLTGLDSISYKTPIKLKGKKVAVLCHAPSINSRFEHIINLLGTNSNIELGAIFGPQHGLFGETQDNMIEWEGYRHPDYDVPIYSLYGAIRKPETGMLVNIDAFIIDLQDIGARPYTYIWSMKNCMEACKETGIPVWILDRPNPVSTLGSKGPVLEKEYYTFVGGAEIPMCHNMTIGEIALWLNYYENIHCDINIEWMEGWERGMSYFDTGLPWVPPSPNMPSLTTACVYPGTVLTEALNLSEGRGTTTPFELFGAPDLNIKQLLRNLKSRDLTGCKFRSHDYIPTFHKYKDQYLNGIFLHVINAREYDPVFTSISIYDAIMETSPGYLTFNDPPYEYENMLVPFDILIGDSVTRKLLADRKDISIEKERWKEERKIFNEKFQYVCHY